MSTIAEVKKRIADGSSSARGEVEAALKRAEAASKFHPILTIIRERALKRADEVDEALKNSQDVGPLAGVPFIAKDNMLTFGAPTTAAAKILENFDAPFQAEAIERLEAAGAILIAKSNLDAFAHGSSTENSAYGPTKNPHDESRVPGGSSGGSAVSVALDIVPFALGTDTGGSIRQPASFCGVVGFKPTYGAVSRYGVVAMASSTDIVGPLTQTAEDAALVLSIMGGQDKKDSTTLPNFFKPQTAQKPLKIGLITEWMGEGLDEPVKLVTEAAIKTLRGLGHTVNGVSLPHIKYAIAVYYVVVPAEIASNLARYDGVRYGNQVAADSLEELYTHTREAGFMPENKRRILIGNYVLSSGYYDAYYKKAQQVRTLIIRDFERIWGDYDLLIGPVVPTPAFRLGENTDDPLKMYLADIMTAPASLAGLPAVSMPAGKSADGLPIGLQIIGPQRSDALVLSLGTAFQKNHQEDHNG